MGFSGGGSNVLKPHKHSSAVQDGSPLDMNNVTEATLNAGDIVYSDGAALQRLPIGSTTDSLVVSGGVPSWGAATSNPLIKVTKTFSDIDLGTTSMDIYTLPVNAALTNVYTDITTVFDLSTAVTIGDAGDNSGFQQSTDWTAGTGLTDATRGNFVTTFKTMRSVSGTTAIKAYNFNTSGNALVKDAQATNNDSASGTTITNSAFTVANNSNRILVVSAGCYDATQNITGVTWNAGAESFTRAVFLDNGGARTEIWYLVNPTATTADVVTTWASSTGRRGAGVYSYYNADQTTPIGITNTANGVSSPTTGTLTPTTTGSLIVDCEISSQNAAATDTLTAGWTSLIGGTDRSFSSQYDLTPTISASNNMFYSYPGTPTWTWCSAEIKQFVGGSDTQGEVDFYLQVVD
mgnify:CR=1 FL=1|jgi:hypothetical protein